MGRARFIVYQDREKLWRWKFVAPNGRIIAESGEGYSRRSKARDAVIRLGPYVRSARAPETT